MGLQEDGQGRPIPQYQNAAGTGYEAWKGADGHGNVRSADGQIVSIGATTDVEASSGNGSVIALLKRLRTLLGGIVLGAGSALIGKVQIRNTADDANIDPVAEGTFTDYVEKSTISEVAEITPNDTGDLDLIAIYVGSAGNVKVDFKDGGSEILMKNLEAGKWHFMKITRVYDTDTTADDILGAV